MQYQHHNPVFIDDVYIYGACCMRMFVTTMSQNFSGDDIPLSYLEANKKSIVKKRTQTVSKNWHMQHLTQIFIDDINVACCLRTFVSIMSQKFSGDDITYNNLGANKNYEWHAAKLLSRIGICNTNTPHPVFYWWYIFGTCCVRMFVTIMSHNFSGEDIPNGYLEAEKKL